MHCQFEVDGKVPFGSYVNSDPVSSRNPATRYTIDCSCFVVWRPALFFAMGQHCLSILNRFPKSITFSSLELYRQMLRHYMMQILAESTWPSYREFRITSTKLKKTFDLQ